MVKVPPQKQQYLWTEQDSTKARTHPTLLPTSVCEGKYLYAHIMKWPSDGKIQIKSLATGSPYCKGEIEKVELLGGGKAKFRRTSKGLLIDLPKDKTPNPISLVLKITNR